MSVSRNTLRSMHLKKGPKSVRGSMRETLRHLSADQTLRLLWEHLSDLATLFALVFIFVTRWILKSGLWFSTVSFWCLNSLHQDTSENNFMALLTLYTCMSHYEPALGICFANLNSAFGQFISSFQELRTCLHTALIDFLWPVFPDSDKMFHRLAQHMNWV